MKTNLMKLLKASAIALPLIITSCEKKPDYMSKIDEKIRIDYEKMSPAPYYSRQALEKELDETYSSGVGIVSLFFGGKKGNYNKNVVGAWDYHKEGWTKDRIYAITKESDPENFTPFMNPKNKSLNVS